jgi:hypothetical protein
LARLLGDEDLRCSLALVAPEVHAEAQRYRAAVDAGQSGSARARKAERGLLQYVTRALVRTSPLSRFTAVGLAVPDGEGIAPDQVRFEGAEVFPGVDRVMLGYVLGGLSLSDDEALLDAWVGLPPTSAVDNGLLFFLRTVDGAIRRHSVPVSGPVKLLLDAVGMGQRRTHRVIADVADRLGCLPEGAAQLVLGAVRQGILCGFDREEDGGADVMNLLDRSEGLGSDLFVELRTALPRLGRAPSVTRGAELERIRSNLAQVSYLAGRPAQITVEEDFVVPPIEVATESWSGPLADLGTSVELLSVFDWLHDVRAVMTAAFVERFGAGANVSLTEHADFLVAEVTRRAAAMDAAYRAGGDLRALSGIGPSDGSLERLYALRANITEMIGTRITKAADAGDPELTLAASDVDEILSGLPQRFRRDPLSYGVLVQQAGDRLILNDGLPGHGMLYARFLAADRDLGGTALARLRQRLLDLYGWDGSKVVEDLGLHRLNVNAHPPILPTGLSPEDWFTLRLAHDPDVDQLCVQDAQDARLRVLPLGTGHPGLFPPPLSVASGLVISGRLYNSLPNTWLAASGWDGVKTKACPRMCIGDVVLARRRWYGGVEFDTAFATGPPALDRLLALTSWRARHDVPAEVVVKNAPKDEGPLSVGAPEAQARRLRQKPQYVDLASALGVRALPKMLARRDDAGLAYLEEAVPGVTDGSYATEWVVEIDRAPGGRFRYGGEDR